MLLSVCFVFLFNTVDLSNCFHVFYWLPQNKSELYFPGSYISEPVTLCQISFGFSIYKTLLLPLISFLGVNVVCHVTLQFCKAAV